MVQRLDIQFIHAKADENIQKYVQKKIGRLDRYLPRHARENAHAEVLLKENHAKGGRNCCVEVTLHVPLDLINVSETSLNMYTAVDIVELKLKQQIRKYKELHSSSFRRRLATRLAR